jgi:hypothetical protein
MAIEIVEVTTRRLLRRFIHLPEKINKGYSNWLPPVYLDEWKFFNPGKNKAFALSDTTLVLALKDGIPAGRIMGIIHMKYNDLHQELHGRFGYMECYNDPEISHALLNYIEDWARKKGMNQLIGPYGFSDKDPQGFLIEGFQHMPILDSACNQPYMIDLITQEGYTKEIDCHIYKMDISNGLPEVYSRIAQRLEQKPDYKILAFSSRKQLKPYIVPVLRLLNETYDHLYGFVPMSDEEINDFANRYLPVIDPRFVKVIEKDGVLLGFLVGMPNITKGIQQSGGYLFPFGIFKILRSAKRTKQLDLMLGAVRKDYRGLGFEVAMGLRIIESAKLAGFEHIEVHVILETNKSMISEMERLNIPVHKKFRVYRKDL